MTTHTEKDNDDRNLCTVTGKQCRHFPFFVPVSILSVLQLNAHVEAY